MKYLYWDLGEQQQDSGVVVHTRGSAANVILLDPVSFDRYRYGLAFHYTGGLYTSSPARLEIPKDGRWYLVIDCCGYQHHVQVEKIRIVRPEESPSAPEESPRAREESPRALERSRAPQPDSTLVGAAA